VEAVLAQSGAATLADLGAALVVIGIAGLAMGHAVPALLIGLATLVVTTALAVATQLRTAREAVA